MRQQLNDAIVNACYFFLRGRFGSRFVLTKLTEITQARRLTLFEHIARVDESADTKRKSAYPADFLWWFSYSTSCRSRSFEKYQLKLVPAKIVINKRE